MVCVYLFLVTDSLKHVPDVTIIHAYRNGTSCVIDRAVDSRITFITSYITDFVLLSLMLFGVSRWRKAHSSLPGGIWWVMYRQVGIPHPAVVTLTMRLDICNRDCYGL